MANQETRTVGRLTRSLPLSRPVELPVHVARVRAAPFCEPRNGSGLTQTPYNIRIIRCSHRGHPALLSRLSRLNRATPFRDRSSASALHL